VLSLSLSIVFADHWCGSTLTLASGVRTAIKARRDNANWS
jgi:hypothetical protein